MMLNHNQTMSLYSLNRSSAFPSSPVKARILSESCKFLDCLAPGFHSDIFFHSAFLLQPHWVQSLCVAACCNWTSPLQDVYLACFFTFCLMFLLKNLFSVIASLDTTQNFNIPCYFLSPFLLCFFLTFALITNILYILIIYLV